MRHQYQIIVSPSSVDRKEVLHLPPGENWLTVVRDPSDGVVRPRLVAAAEKEILANPSSSPRTFASAASAASSSSSSNVEPAEDTAAAAGDGFRLCLQYHRGLLLVKDESQRVLGSATSAHPRHDQLVVEDKRPWRAWYSLAGSTSREASKEETGTSNDQPLVPMEPRQAIWLPHEGRLILRQDDAAGGSQEEEMTVPGNVSPPHLVWLEFRCKDEAGREAAQYAVRDVAQWEEPTGTDSASLRPEALEADTKPVHAEDKPEAKSEASSKTLVESSSHRHDLHGTPQRSAAVAPPPNSHTPGSFVYTADTQTPPPPLRKSLPNDGQERGSPKRQDNDGEAALSSAVKHNDAKPESSVSVNEDVKLSRIEDNPEQVKDKVEDDDDVSMSGANQSQGGADAVSAPHPLPVPLPSQPSTLCTPVDDLLTQPPDRDDNKVGRPVTDAAESQAQESQAVAPSASNLGMINETVTRKVDNKKPEDDDDETVDPDDLPHSDRKASAAEKASTHPPLEVTPKPIAVAQRTHLPEDPETPNRQNTDTDGSPHRSPPEYSPTASDLGSQSLLTPPSATTKQRQRRRATSPPSTAPAQEAPTPATECMAAPPPYAGTPPPKAEIANGSPSVASMQEPEGQTKIGTANISQRVVGDIMVDVDDCIKNTDSRERLTSSESVLVGAGKEEPHDPSGNKRGAVPEEDEQLSNENSKTPKSNKDELVSRESLTTERAAPSPRSPATSTRQQTEASTSDDAKLPPPRTPVSRAAKAVVEDPSVRRSTRKRSPSANACSALTPTQQKVQPPRKKARGGDESHPSADLDVQAEENVHPRRTGGVASCYVLTTSFDEAMSQKIANMVKKLGGVLIEELKDAHKCTHLVASDGTTSIKRTPKLMIALCVTTNIVTLKWLQDSVASGKVRDAKPYLILKDKEAEKAYSFSMTKTLQRVKERQKEGTSLLQGRTIYVCPTVFKNTEDGKKSPPAADFQLLVGAAGGTWIEKAKDLNATNPRDLLVITNGVTKMKNAQLKQKDVASALENGAAAANLKSFLHAMMTQDVRSLDYSHGQ